MVTWFWKRYCCRFNLTNFFFSNWTPLLSFRLPLFFWRGYCWLYSELLSLFFVFCITSLSNMIVCQRQHFITLALGCWPCCCLSAELKDQFFLLEDDSIHAGVWGQLTSHLRVFLYQPYAKWPNQLTKSPSSDPTMLLTHPVNKVLSSELFSQHLHWTPGLPKQSKHCVRYFVLTELIC